MLFGKTQQKIPVNFSAPNNKHGCVVDVLSVDLADSHSQQISTAKCLHQAGVDEYLRGCFVPIMVDNDYAAIREKMDEVLGSMNHVKRLPYNIVFWQWPASFYTVWLFSLRGTSGFRHMRWLEETYDVTP